jgi:hypothetical protein
MKLYAILRRNGWKTAKDLEAAAERSTKVGNADMHDEVRWIRTYVLAEADGTLGSVCIYEAIDADALKRHADKAELPCNEVRQVVDTVVVRPDPAR